MLTSCKSRIKLEVGQTVFAFRSPYYYGNHGYVGRGEVKWIDLDAGMVYVDWERTMPDHIKKTLGANDFDRYDTQFAVLLNHAQLHPAWVTEEGLSPRNNAIFKYTRFHEF